MKRFLFAAAAAVTVLPATAYAQDAEPGTNVVEPGTEATADVDPEDRDIVVSAERDERRVRRCRSVRVTGTRFSERVCMTVVEVDEQRENNRNVLIDGRYQTEPPHEYDENGVVKIPTP